MNTAYTIEKILNKPANRLTAVFGNIALDRAHLEIALRRKGIHALRLDLEKLEGVTAIGAKLARSLRR